MVFYHIFDNPGICLICVSVFVSTICLPLYAVAEHWQQVERDTEKKLENGVNRIKSVFKGDEQYMILSTYYRENHYQPIFALRSSIGLLIQIPFFIAAYLFLSHLELLSNASFLFIKDLARPDSLFKIGNFSVNILPILMTAINCIAGAIYTKGFKLKEKIQIYAMAIVFLILLYDSPSGLVLYWTMNNVYSLIKNIFYKIKNPKKKIYILLCILVLCLDVYLLIFNSGNMLKRIIASCALTSFVLIPFVIRFLKQIFSNNLQNVLQNDKQRLRLFLSSAITMTVLVGLTIPALLISSSPNEFADIDTYKNPVQFIYLCFLQSFGLFFFWSTCIYFLFSKKIQTYIAVTFAIIAVISLGNTFLFNSQCGSISNTLAFDIGAIPSGGIKTLLLCVLFAAVVCYLVIFICRKNKMLILVNIFQILLFSLMGIGVYKIFYISKIYNSYEKEVAATRKSAEVVSPVFHLNKQGRNVIVLMLDRAESSYVKDIFDSMPTLYDDFEGFTFYENTASANGHTLQGAPGLFGGYEYCPAEMNKRDTEKLVDKNNEALSLLSKVFTEQGNYKSYVADIPWANYNVASDMKFMENYANTNHLQNKFSKIWLTQNSLDSNSAFISKALERNLFQFGIFRISIPFVRNELYDNGNWFSSSINSITNLNYLIGQYSELDFLPQLTDFSENEHNVFVSFDNELCHVENTRLPFPSYKPQSHIQSEDSNFNSLKRCYDVNAASYVCLSRWLQYLKENDCYDNTKIIIVADHSIPNNQGLGKLDFSQNIFVCDPYHPVLMVKDFNSKNKMNFNSHFMTNADVPNIALSNCIENPINPYTHKRISDGESIKQEGFIISTSDCFMPDKLTNEYTYPVKEEEWYSVKNDVTVKSNWTKLK